MLAQTKIDLNEFRLLRDYIEEHCGISLTDDKMYLVETRLTTLMAESGCQSFIDLYFKAVADSTYGLRDKIVEAMTTNETLWFRDEGTFSILEELLINELGPAMRAGKQTRIKIWCTACSTGQEPYSAAMTVLELARKGFLVNPECVEIFATDISSTVLYLAMAGRYDNFAISRGLPEDLRNRYFDLDGNVWVINNDVKKMVRYQKLNLQESFAFIGRQDFVFCRNVLIYFSDEFREDILRRITELLRPNGYLFVGSSESIIHFTHDYEVLRHTRGLYYKVKQEKAREHNAR